MLKTTALASEKFATVSTAAINILTPRRSFTETLMNSSNTSAANAAQASYRFGIAMVVGGALLFSAKAVFVKLAYQYNIDPTSLMTLRMLICAPIYLFIAYRCTRTTPLSSLSSGLITKILLSGLMGYYLASFLDLSGLRYITANLERLILYTYPSIVLIITAVRYKRSLHLGELVCLAASYGGIALVFGTDMTLYDNTTVNIFADIEIDSTLWGALLVFGSALAFSCYLVSAERTMKTISSAMFTSLAMLGSTTAIIIHFLLTRELNQLLGYPIGLYALAFAVAIFSTILPSFMMAEGIKRITATRASIIGSVGPVSTMIMGVLFLDETITVFHVAGLAVVVISSLALSKFKPV
ncbi:MAG: drug/metabolite transporter (DMT)-like permease [Flavobacteriales bacterium]|jgi:drug/metabolite transporter (DMT)-like permease